MKREIPNDLKFTKEHEWVRIDNDVAEVGITDHAQAQLGDVVYVELPSVGTKLEQEKVFGVVESVKAVSDLFVPASGEVTEVNQDVVDTPEMINQDPYGKAWMLKIKLSNKEELEHLMNAQGYEQYLRTLAK